MSRSSRATSRGERTREQLLDVAERLLSERGIDGVSLREIRLAAGQRNTSALQFHFGDREGLLRAIVERHRPRMDQRLVELYRKAIDDGRLDDPRRLVEIIVRPIAEPVFGGPSPRAWVRICADLAARPELAVHDFVAEAPPEAVDVGVRLLDQLEEIVPRHIGLDRIFMMSLATLHLCADRARIENAPRSGRTHMSPGDFVQNVIDMAYSALFAPLRSPREAWAT